MIVIPVVIFILLLFGAGTITLLSIRKDFARELDHLDALEAEIQLAAGVSPTNFYQAVKGSLDIPPDSIVGERVEMVFRLSDKNISLSLSEMSELAISAKETGRKTQTSNFVLSVLLISGLGGTFLAFREILANSDLRNTISNGVIDVTKYDAAVTRIYDGFNSAFWASICGVFGTVALLFFKHIFVNPVKDRFFNRLDFVTQAELVPIFSSLRKKPADLLSRTATKLDALIASLQPVSQDLNSVTGKATGAVADLNNFAAVLGGATDKFSNLTGPSSPLLTAITQLFEGVEKYESRYHNYETALNSLIKEIKDQGSRSAETQLMFVKFHATLEGTQQQFQADLKQLNKTYQDEIAGMAKGFRDEVRAIIQSTRDVIHKVQELYNQLQMQQGTYAKDFKAATEKLDLAMGRIEATAKALDSSVDKIGTPAQEMLASISQVRNVLRSIEASMISQADIDAIQVGLKTINRTLERKKFSLSLFGWRR
ncbi:MAG TPA: hypothetical protein VJH03_02130 [Blastocatellia bacterium]|nr:hypothetical protein [Blastocatellia bacterium]